MQTPSPQDAAPHSVMAVSYGCAPPNRQQSIGSRHRVLGLPVNDGASNRRRKPIYAFFARRPRKPVFATSAPWTLRTRGSSPLAKSALQDRFSEKAFHNAMLSVGSMPLAVLETEIQRYIRGSDDAATSLVHLGRAPFPPHIQDTDRSRPSHMVRVMAKYRVMHPWGPDRPTGHAPERARDRRSRQLMRCAPRWYGQARRVMRSNWSSWMNVGKSCSDRVCSEAATAPAFHGSVFV
jgi:hypothetical protein